MAALWDGYEFDSADLEFWTQEVFSAAIDLPLGERDPFLRVACEGSDDLKRRVSSLLDDALETGSSQALDQTCKPGDVVRDCLILCRIGKGATAEVYKAIQKSLRRLVAVKVINRIGLDELAALAREATSTCRLDHEHIIGVYDADFTSEKPCVVMEYVDGITLREWLRREKQRNRLPPSNAVITSITKQLADALGEAHSHKIIHRDIKPENILMSTINDAYSVKVVDFGLARHTSGSGGGVVGTPGYISPEQLSGERPDERADIFSLGVILYEMVTGEHPFLGRSDLETLHNTLHTHPVLLKLETLGKYGKVISKALEKAPSDRYQSVNELFSDLCGVDSPPILENQGNPFLSEFPLPVRKWMERNSLGFKVAAASFFWGCLSLILGILSGAACLKVVWKPVVGNGSFEMIYGYAVEMNAGLWYLICPSFCLLGGFGLLQAAHSGLAETPALTSVGLFKGTPPLERVARINRQCFTYMLPFVVVLAACVVLVPEIALREKNAFGWVQADLAQQFIDADYSELRSQGKIGDLPAVRGLCTGCSVRVTSLRNFSGGYRPPRPALFYAFLLSALTHQIILSALFAYLAFKILFFFGFLSKALLGKDDFGLRLTPDLQDRGDYRFGLGRLDNVYYAVLILLSLATTVGFLQAITNLNKGTYFLGGKEVVPLIGQPLVLMSALIMLTSFVLTPIILFMFLTIRVVNQELARLSSLQKQIDKEAEKVRLPADRERLHLEMKILQDRRDVLAMQSLLPTKSGLFRGLLVVNVVFLLILPPALIGTDIGANAGHFMSVFLCALCGNS